LSDELALQKVIAQRLFQSSDEAAKYALNSVTDPTYELGGVVFQDPQGLYTTSEPVGNKRTGKFEATVRIPKGSKAVGLFHTHPGDPSLSETFSSDDVHVADTLKMLSYIRAMESGQIKKYEPGVSRIDTAGTGLKRTKISRGDTIE